VGGLEFLGILATFAIVLAWYVQNTEAKSEGALGWLALAAAPSDAGGKKKKSYRIKQRVARRAHEIRDLEGLKAAGANAKPSYRTTDDETHRSRRAFRIIDDARYRKTKSGTRYKTRTGPAAEYSR